MTNPIPPPGKPYPITDGGQVVGWVATVQEWIACQHGPVDPEFDADALDQATRYIAGRVLQGGPTPPPDRPFPIKNGEQVIGWAATVPEWTDCQYEHSRGFDAWCADRSVTPDEAGQAFAAYLHDLSHGEWDGRAERKREDDAQLPLTEALARAIWDAKPLDKHWRGAGPERAECWKLAEAVVAYLRDHPKHLTALMRARLAEIDTPGPAAEPVMTAERIGDAFAAINRVRSLHRPHRIYEECEHHHTQEDVDEGRAVDFPDVGTTCGYLYTICHECCTRGSGYQLEECCTDHLGIGCHPCSTLRALDEAGES